MKAISKRSRRALVDHSNLPKAAQGTKVAQLELESTPSEGSRLRVPQLRLIPSRLHGLAIQVRIPSKASPPSTYVYRHPRTTAISTIMTTKLVLGLLAVALLGGGASRNGGGLFVQAQLGADYIETVPPTVYEAEEMSPQNMDFDRENNMFIAHAGWYNDFEIHYYKFRIFAPGTYEGVIVSSYPYHPMQQHSADVSP